MRLSLLSNAVRTEVGGTGGFASRTVDSSTSLRVSVFDCQEFSAGWGVVFHPEGSPPSYGVQLQK